MKKHIVLRSLFAAFIVLGLIFIGNGTVQVVATTFASADTEHELEMRVVKNRWRWDPDVIVVPYGSLVRLTIENEDDFDHGIAIREFGLDRRLPAGRTTTVQFIADQEGEFEFFCSVYCGTGHFDQKGTLVVTHDDVDDVAARYGAGRGTEGLPVRSRADAISRLPYAVDEDGVKVFELTAEHIMWDYGNDAVIESWGYNGQLPGPEIRVTEGDVVRINFTNKLPVATTVHWHGVDVPFLMDGVPGYTQDPVQPGETFVYEFTAYPAGTRFYHTHGSHHGDEAEQMDMGLAGAFVIEPREFDRPDIDYTMVLTERIRDGAYPINGAVYPDTEFIVVEEGQRVRIRMINAGSSTFHPMHLHGHQFRVVATDGNPVPEAAQLTRNTLPLLPGESYDVEFIANNPGIWLLHCHELQHAGGGMITAVVYDQIIGGEFSAVDHTGRTVTHETFDDGYSLITFGYTNCPDICGINLSTMSAAIRELGPDGDRVNALFVTIDPERDTPEVLGDYVRAYGNRVTGITGTPEQIADLAGAYAAKYEPVDQSNGGYSMDHSTTVYLMGPGGRYIAQFSYASGTDRIVAAIRNAIERDSERVSSQ
ncbi:MAG: hypothetical protein EA426_12565 [Spirochaetaceae bacterium]|nr:MAG: hypothetical protein EA426_12565 [Spirochaetaceae bacterium]